MIVSLIIVIILMGARLVYLEYTRIDQEAHLEAYRILVLEWYHYLHNKEHSEDFEMWRAELDE